MTARFVFIFIALLSLNISGCTNTQQDTLLEKTMAFGRHAVGFDVRTQDVGDVQMNYMERQADGPVVVLVHGFSANKETWLKLAAELPENYYLIAPDLAGHGETPAPDNGDYNLVRQAERIHALMAAKGIRRFHIAGNSMGGAISAIYATLYPQQLESLILIDSAGVDAPQPSLFMQSLAEGQNPLIATDKKSFEYRWNLIMEEPPFVPWPIRPAIVRKTINRADINREIFSDMLATKETLNEKRFEQDLHRKVTMPTLILWGEKDHILDVSAAGVFKQLIPQAEVTIYPETGHVPQIEVPEETAASLVQFISSL
ncbi:MAG: alpha/beta hydrolase [Oceanospirillaceae bacterium]|nr:alpha/beta hydrolase [Oceanospirillaceae bacterium]|tara:strand:+ start:54737 stop:55681 length:945 start_codon:yes stop_codon:yes gene_type:complete